jgi:hypothetical protein
MLVQSAGHPIVLFWVPARYLVYGKAQAGSIGDEESLLAGPES